MLAKDWLRFWNSDSTRLIIFQDTYYIRKSTKKLRLETCCLKSMKYLVTLLYYYIIQRFREDGTELKKKIISISRFAS